VHRKYRVELSFRALLQGAAGLSLGDYWGIMMRETLTAIYLDWLNNFASVAAFAECNGLHEDEAARLIALAREVYDTTHPDA